VVVSEQIANYFEDNMLFCGLTYSGHPLACAAALATVQVYQDDGLIENSAALGRVLGERLEEMKDRHPSVGDVRYIGLFAAIELVKDRASREPLIPWNAKGDELAPKQAIAAYNREKGLYVFQPKHMLLIAPPLCITMEQLEEGLAIIDGALELADQEVLA
jgi:taurine--2-oxoglutarate transaminase